MHMRAWIIRHCIMMRLLIGRFLASRGLHRKPVALVMKTSSRLAAAIYGGLYSGNYYTALPVTD